MNTLGGCSAQESCYELEFLCDEWAEIGGRWSGRRSRSTTLRSPVREQQRLPESRLHSG